MAYWIVVGADGNMRIAEAAASISSASRAPAATRSPRCSRAMKLGGLAEVTSAYFEDHTQVFRSSKPGEDYPFRVKVEPIVVLPPEQYPDVKEIASGLEFTKKWPAEHWRLAFEGNLHEIPDSDYKRIEGLMRGVGTRGRV